MTHFETLLLNSKQDQVRGQVRYQIYNQIRFQVRFQVRCQVGDQVWPQAGVQVDQVDQVDGRVIDQVREDLQ